MKIRTASSSTSQLLKRSKLLHGRPSPLRRRQTLVQDDERDTTDPSSQTITLGLHLRRPKSHSEVKNAFEVKQGRMKTGMKQGRKSIKNYSHRKLAVLVCISLFLILTWAYYLLSPSSRRQQYPNLLGEGALFFRSDYSRRSSSFLVVEEQRCSIPQLNPYDDEIMRLLSEAGDGNNRKTYNCSHQMASQDTIFEVDHGTIHQMREFAMKEWSREKPKCCYTPFHRANDQENERDRHCLELTGRETKVQSEFVELFCKLPVFHQDYKDMFALVPDKEEVERRLKKIRVSPEGEQLSVIILGMDSVSHMNFIRQMPLSQAYLEKELGAVALRGYTKVAENTLPNVVPLLTGLPLSTFKRLCVYGQEQEESIRLDGCPFIWKDFAARGYRTSFAEDQNAIGIFNMYWPRAFDQQPTDYYLRTLTREMELHFGGGQCQGSRLSFQVLLDNVLNLANAFKNRLHFQFSWSTRLSHDDPTMLSLGDAPLMAALRRLNDLGHLNRSALLLLSDHGSRLDKFRATRQGKLEDRLPLAYVTVPPWLHSKYPRAVANLRDNSERLTTPFDIYETLWDLMDLTRLGQGARSNHGRSNSQGFSPKSLFSQISENRTCSQAGIPLHWCLCHGKENVSTDSDLVKDAVDFAVSHMNQLLKERMSSTSSCSQLQLQKITEAWRTKGITQDSSGQTPPPLGSLGSNPSNEDPSSLPPTSNPKAAAEADQPLVVTALWVSFITEPGEGSFEATLIKVPVSTPLGFSWELAEKIVRTNKYGDQSYCVDDFDLKEYCFCEQLDYGF